MFFPSIRVTRPIFHQLWQRRQWRHHLNNIIIKIYYNNNRLFYVEAVKHANKWNNHCSREIFFNFRAGGWFLWRASAVKSILRQFVLHNFAQFYFYDYYWITLYIILIRQLIFFRTFNEKVFINLLKVKLEAKFGKKVGIRLKETEKSLRPPASISNIWPH